MSYVNALFHITFSTKNRVPALNRQYREVLFAYIAGIIRNKSKHYHIVNGVEDHIHILVDLHQNQSISEFVKEVKRCSSLWISASGKFPLFNGWNREYAAFSCSASHKQAVVEYIKNQEEHHKTIDSESEFKRLLARNA